MPRVLCINDEWDPNFKRTIGVNPPVFNQDYIAIDQKKCSCGCGANMYVLIEYGPMYGFDVKHFVELDGPDEKEMIRYEPSQHTAPEEKILI